MPHSATTFILIAFAIRLVFSIYAAYEPIPNERGIGASPLNPAPSSDLSVYQHSRELYFTGNIKELLSGFQKFYGGAGSSPAQVFISAPVLPLLLLIFDYNPSNTLPLAIFFFAIGLAVVAAWLRYFQTLGIPALWLFLFVLLPHPVWFTINLGSDLLGAAIFTAFFLIYFGQIPTSQRIPLSFVLIILYLFTRPNGVSLLIFFVLDHILLNKEIERRYRYIILTIIIIIFAPFFIFYLPYLISFTTGSASLLPYYGVTSREYLEGIYSFLPLWLNLFLSWVSLFAAKILHLVGLRGSYGETSMFLVLVRAAPGLIFLPGLALLAFKANRSIKLLVFLFLLPVILGATQDRYILPLQPLLFLYGYFAYSYVWSSVTRRNGGAATSLNLPFARSGHG